MHTFVRLPTLKNNQKMWRHRISIRTIFSLSCLMLLVFSDLYGQTKNLDYFLKTAKENNPFLADIQNQALASKLDSLIFRASNGFQTNGNLYANYAPVIDGYGYDTAISNGQTITGLVTVSKPIVLNQTLRTRRESFSIVRNSLTNNLKIAVKDLNRSITAQYISAFGDFQQLKFNEDLLHLLQEESEILKELVRAAVYRQSEYLIFAGTMQQQQFVVQQWKNQYANDLALLYFLSGDEPTQVDILSPPNITLGSPFKIKETANYNKFVLDSLTILNQDKLIDTNYRPKLGIFADGGYNSSFQPQAYKNFGTSIGLSLSVPIYDGGQRKLQHQKNELALKTNTAYKQFFENQSRQQLQQLHVQLDQINQLNAQLEKQLELSEALIETNRKLLVNGEARITEFLLSIGNLTSVKNNVIQNEANRLQIINQINYWAK